MRRLVVFGIMSLVACSPESPEVTPAPRASEKEEAAGPPAPDSVTPDIPAGYVLAEMEVVDLDGNPLPNMLPIATTEANAFNPPVAQGDPTNGQGRSSILMPNDRYLYVRAWDPELKKFAINYYDMPPSNNSGTTEPTRVAMAPGATITAVVHDIDGAPVVSSPVEVLMVIPGRGPWWPAHGTTGDSGDITIGPVPPGKYTLLWATPAAGRSAQENVTLQPEASVELGMVTLGPSGNAADAGP